MKIWSWICDKLLTDSNRKRAMEAIDKEVGKLLEKQKAKDAKQGIADIAVVCIVAIILNAFTVICASHNGQGGVGFGDRMNAITVNQSSNVTITATVSPTGGGSLSVPLTTGGGK